VRESTDVERCMRFAAGRMRYKLEAARRALRSGVPAVHVSSSRIPRPVFAALGGEAGTRLTLPKAEAADA